MLLDVLFPYHSDFITAVRCDNVNDGVWFIGFHVDFFLEHVGYLV